MTLGQRASSLLGVYKEATGQLLYTIESRHRHFDMQAAVIFALLALASAAPAPEKLPEAGAAVAAAGGAVPAVPVAIIRQVQVNPDALGAHSSDFEAENGIAFQFSGSEGVLGGANMIGSWSYPQADGTLASVSFVADENGFQPQSSLLPVAPAFPHPIPQFVLDQIEFARLEDERRAKEEATKA
ncbi:cuticle protein CP14.6-like [Macrobrachium rosenbergii]|uniref:cuticle protein CP14.6-like n=1 Tax=Macrobrachium rosenbergii TaxID=79674 RepID=UPI0034D588B0